MAIYAQITQSITNVSGTRMSGVIYISIFDAATNLPANGNNCQVVYQKYINGILDVGPPLSVIIPGLSTPIYTGLITDTNPVSPFYVTYQIVSLAPGTGITPDPSADDLTIINAITTPESAAGAHDGTVTINATSSFPIIQYSLDNINWQNSNVFAGLSTGARTAYTKDANNGAKQIIFQVGLVGNNLQSEPTIDLGNGNLSRWNAAFNNIWFKFHRKDFEITDISQDVATGKISVNINADLTNVTVRTIVNTANPQQPQVTTPGDFVYIKTAKYTGSFEALSKTSGALVLDCPFVTNDSVGYININSLRPYYTIQTQITYVNPITGKFNTIISTNTPDITGYCEVDLQSFLKSLLVLKDLSNYTLINYRDAQLSASYQIKYAEVWNGNAPQWVTINRPYYVLYTARQLQQKYGGNMAEFVPYLLGFQPAKWLTEFLNPVYSYGFPFDLSFIFSEYMVGQAPFYEIILLDINKNPLADQSVNPAFLLNQNGGYQLNQDGSKFIIAEQALVATPISEQIGLNRLLINFNPPTACWYFSVQLKYNNTGSPATFNYTLAEQVSPEFIDANIQIKNNGAIVTDLLISGSGSLTIKAGNTYSIEGYCQLDSGSANAKLRMTVTRTISGVSVVIFDQQIPAVPGASLVKSGIAQPGAVYTPNIITLDTTIAVTPIDVADNNTVSQTPYPLTIAQICRIDQNTPDKPVYLRWIGLTGSWNYYKFVYNQLVDLDVSNPIIIKNFVTNWENADTIEDVISKNAGQKMTVFGENVLLSDIKGVQSIKYSPKVQLLTSVSPIKWQTVIIAPGTYNEYETNLDQYSVKITFNLPSINTQNQ